MATMSSEEIAYQEIISMIMMHDLPPGSTVVELNIAEKLKMSRTPVRSALKRLVADGLLDNGVQRGCYVPFLSRKDLDSLFNFRYVVEVACVREAAIKFKPVYKEKMVKLLEEEDRCLKDNGNYFHIINEKIHTLIVDIADNNYYLNPIKRVIWRSQLYLFFFDNFYKERKIRMRKISSGDFKSKTQHEQIFDAISNNDTDYSSSLMKAHITSTYEMLTRNSWGSIPDFL